jgi:hypothetical protein
MAAKPKKSTKSATQPSRIKALNISLGVEFEFLVLECYETIQEPTPGQLGTAAYKLSLLKKKTSFEAHSIHMFVLRRNPRLHSTLESTKGTEGGF